MNQEQLFKMGLLEAVQELHTNITGNSDTCNYGEFKMYDIYSALLEKLDTWTPSTKNTQLYDNVIKMLVHVVVREFETYRGF